MTTFRVDDMTCGRCAGKISSALAALDPSATVEISIAQKLVRVTGDTDPSDVADAIRGAGYTPQPVQQVEAPVAPSRGGCGCASRKAAAVDPRATTAPASGSCCG